MPSSLSNATTMTMLTFVIIAIAVGSFIAGKQQISAKPVDTNSASGINDYSRAGGSQLVVYIPTTRSDNNLPSPPERLPDDVTIRNAIPMALATAGLPSSYRQVGILRKTDDNPEHDDVIMPLFGSKMQPNRSRWNYYTAGGAAGTLPVRSQNRDCMDQYTGCDEIYDGDNVTVDGLKNGVFQAMMYTVAAPRYDSRIL